MGQGCDIIVSELDDAMSIRSRLRVRVSVLGVLEGLPGMLVPRRVILFALLLGNPMGMRGAVV
jgi:hypothetical protein